MSASGPKWMLSTLVSECSGTSEPLLREGVWLANSHSQERSVWGRGCFRSLSIFLYNIPPPPNSFLSRNQIQKVGVLDQESQR